MFRLDNSKLINSLQNIFHFVVYLLRIVNESAGCLPDNSFALRHSVHSSILLLVELISAATSAALFFARNKHGIPIAEKPVFVLHRVFIGMHHMLITGKSGHQH